MLNFVDRPAHLRGSIWAGGRKGSREARMRKEQVRRGLDRFIPGFGKWKYYNIVKGFLDFSRAAYYPPALPS